MVANKFASRFVLAGLVLALALTAVMVLAIGLSWAQGPEPGTTEEGPGPNINGWELNWASASPCDGALELGPANLNSGVTQPDSASGGAPRPEGMISYQGQLLQNGLPVIGSVLMTFTLYTSPSGNTVWWQEQQTVQVDDGLFNVDLGAVEPLSLVSPFFQNQPWLGVQPEGAAELTPRQPLGAVGYAYNVMPGATTIDTDDGSAAYVYTFFVSSVNHPAIYGNSAVGSGVHGVASFTETAGINGTAYGTSGIGVYGTTSGHGDNGHGVEGIHQGDSPDCTSSSIECASGVYGAASGDSYGSMFYGENRSASIMMQEDNSYYGLWVQGQTSSAKGIWTNGETTINNDLTVTGAKSGFVVDIALNDGPVPLVKGDVVVISGVDAPVVGNIPVVRVQKAATANATNVMGVVDTRYVPCTDSVQRPKGQACEGFDRSASAIQPGEYLSVVTLGAYEAIKVDATAAPVRSGDLLAASATAGHAFAATPLSVQATSFYAPGTVVGVALGDMDEGTGTVPVFVSPR